MKQYAVMFLAAVMLAAAACGGGEDTSALRTQVATLQTQGTQAAPTPSAAATPVPPPATTTAVPVPPEWQTFDHSAMSGAAPAGWEPYVLTAEDFLNLAKQGLSKSSIGATGKRTIDQVKPSDLAGVVLVFVAGEAGFPNVNVQPCSPGVTPVRVIDGKAFVSEYAAAGAPNPKVAGDVEFEGKQFALLKVEFFKELDTYQAFVGSSNCTSIATLTTRPGDAVALRDFKTVLSALKIAH